MELSNESSFFVLNYHNLAYIYDIKIISFKY